MSQPINEITLLTDQLGIIPQSVTRLEESSFASKVYRIDCGNEKNVLKLHHGSREYWRERRTLELLEPTGLVPKVLGGIPPADGFDGALLLAFIENQNLASLKIDVSTSRMAGACLAHIHQHSLGTLGFFGARGIEVLPHKGWWSFRRHLLTGAWADIIRNRMGDDFVRRCCDRVQLLSAMFSDEESTCLIHCDFRFGNILKRSDGKLSVIDFESSREGNPAYDFIKIWADLGTSQEALEWKSFLDGYSSFRPLPANLKGKIDYYWFDLNFGFLYWAIDRGDESLFQSRLKIVAGLLASA